NRDARPLATSSNDVSCNGRVIVSISTEMPGPWRQDAKKPARLPRRVSISTEMPGPWRPSADHRMARLPAVSISTEMPGPWRRKLKSGHIYYRRYVSTFELASPGAWHLG